VDIRVAFTPPACKPTVAASSAWPQLAAATPAGLIRYSVPPNLTGDPRAAAIQIGEQRIIIEQPAGNRVFFAAVPGRLTFAVTKGKKTEPKRFALVSETTTLTYSIVAAQPWIQATAEKDKRPGQWNVEIRVDPAKLKRGRNEGLIRVTAQGVFSGPVDIPVVAEVPLIR